MYTVGGTVVEFDGVPFCVGEKRMMDCQHGDQYYKSRKPLNKRVCLQVASYPGIRRGRGETPGYEASLEKMG